MWVGAAALGALVIGGLWDVAGGRSSVDTNRPVTRLTIPLTDDQALSSAGSALAISPDGRYVAYVANEKVYLRALNSLETVVVQGSESNVSVSGTTRRPNFLPTVSGWRLRRTTRFEGSPWPVDHRSRSCRRPG